MKEDNSSNANTLENVKVFNAYPSVERIKKKIETIEKFSFQQVDVSHPTSSLHTLFILVNFREGSSEKSKECSYIFTRTFLAAAVVFTTRFVFL